jgi:hypothetical protein
MSFVFRDDDNRAAEIAREFFGPDSVAIGNARALLEIDRAVRATVGQAVKSGEWRRDQEK